MDSMNGAAYDRRGRPPSLGPHPQPNDTRGVAITEFRIELVARDELGSIVTLFTSHGAVDARRAAAEIADGTATYVTGPDSYVRAVVSAISSPVGPYLYVNWDGTRRNNLHELSAGKLVRLSAPARAPRASRWMRVRAALTGLASPSAWRERLSPGHETGAERGQRAGLDPEPRRPEAAMRDRINPFAPSFLDLIRPHGVTPRRRAEWHS
ncbi:hypothetical protein [Leifsonia sp. Root227]|uniref:hypothetical protein n=1 Tax=Leifsonia sp. Root227 TaxID=1736496 RepID=UPI0012F9404E|nr:hypothetical protein [Leifsonia sp. Root227]